MFCISLNKFDVSMEYLTYVLVQFLTFTEKGTLGYRSGRMHPSINGGSSN